MITTTLNRIRKHGPCTSGWTTLLSHLGKTKADDEPIPFSVIVDSNGIEDAIWCCVAEPQYQREWRLFAVWCTRRVQHLMDDPRSLAALDVAEAYAHGQATDSELDAARVAAWDAAGAAAGDAAWAAARAAARVAAGAAAWVAAWDAARDAARVAAGVAAGAAAWVAAGAAARDAQKKEFLRIVTETEARV